MSVKRVVVRNGPDSAIFIVDDNGDSLKEKTQKMPSKVSDTLDTNLDLDLIEIKGGFVQIDPAKQAVRDALNNQQLLVDQEIAELKAIDIDAIPALNSEVGKLLKWVQKNLP